MIRHALPLALGVTLATAGCGGPGGGPGGAGDGAGELTVLAAASLTDALSEAARRYQRDHGVSVTVSFAGSPQVATQVRHGAPADVVVTADRPTMRSLADHVSEVRVIARGELAIAVPPGNPARVRGLTDLGRDELTVVLAAPQVPAGRYARQALSRAGVTVRPASDEPNVRAALSRVRLGEADAAIVYTSDVRAAGADVEAVPIPDRYNVAAVYPAAVVTSSGQRDRARDFLDWLGGEEARATLERHGLVAP